MINTSEHFKSKRAPYRSRKNDILIGKLDAIAKNRSNTTVQTGKEQFSTLQQQKQFSIVHDESQIDSTAATPWLQSERGE
jgi:hypothetical protein